MNGGISDSREDDIRRRAYRIWEDEGRPDNKAEDHWRRAEQEAGGADVIEGIAFGDEPAHDKPVKATRARPVKIAAATAAERPKRTRTPKPK